jgi:hypothetical protein
LLNGPHRELVDWCDDRDGLALIPCSARAAYPVNIVFRGAGHVVIDNV